MKPPFRSAEIFECHITIEPVFGDRLEQARSIAADHAFRIANLLVKTDRTATEQRSDKDTFMTGHDMAYDYLAGRMVRLCAALTDAGYKVWRYKIEEIVVDSRIDGDAYKLLGAPRVNHESGS